MNKSIKNFSKIKSPLCVLWNKLVDKAKYVYRNSSVFLRKFAVNDLIPTLFSTRTSMVNLKRLRCLKLSIIRMRAHKLALVSIVNHQRHYRCFSLRGQMFIVNFSKPQALSRDRCLVRRRK